MYQRPRVLGLILCLTISFACSKDGGVTAVGNAATTTNTKTDPYVGKWVDLKDFSKTMAVQPEGEAYVVEDNRGQKYVATKTNGVLRMSAQTGPIDVLYVQSSDHLIAAGEEYKRFDSKGPEALRGPQLRSMADMRIIATAWEARATDTNSYSVDGVSDGEISYAQLSNALSPV